MMGLFVWILLHLCRFCYLGYALVRLRAQEHSDLIEAETKARKEAMDSVQSQVSREDGASGKPGSSGTNAILQAEGTASNQSNDILRKPNSRAAKGILQ